MSSTSQMLRQKVGKLVIFGITKLFDVNHQQYIDVDKTIEAAESQGRSVCEYVERLYGEEGKTDTIINELKNAGALPPSDAVCEIGPGTGMYLERVLDVVEPSRYHIFEIDKRWAKYLEEQYAPVINHPASGTDLRYTPANSCGVVCSFGVFEILSVINSFNYFDEMIRVCKPDGYIIFDCFLAESWDLSTLQKWREWGETYPVVLPERLLRAFFRARNCELVHTFTAAFACDVSTYVIFKKTL